MLRKTMMALMATIAVGALAPDSALARGGFGGFGGGHGGFGGFHGGGGGWHGGGIAAFRGAPMGGGGVGFRHVGMVGGPHFGPGFHRGFGRRAFIGGALVGAAYAAPYGYYGDYYPYDAYPDYGYYDSGYVEGGCAIVQQPVRTPYGWQYRNVQICQ
jgi:hypothetical protein